MRIPKLLLLLATAGLFACRAATGPDAGVGSEAPSAGVNVQAPIPTAAPEAIALGATVYAAHCAACHGVELEGESDWKVQNEDGTFRAPPHDATGHTWHHGDALLLRAIRLGGARFSGANIGATSNMPAYAETLSDHEMTAVLAYIKSTWPAEIRALQWEATVRETEEAGDD